MFLTNEWDPKRERDEKLDRQYDEMSSFVCEHGPMLLTRGMPPEEANEALLECLKALLSRAVTAERRSAEAHEDKTRALNRLQLANRIIDALPEYSVGMSFLSEERVKTLMERYDAPQWSGRGCPTCHTPDEVWKSFGGDDDA
jgi:hypothetical protein